MARFAVLVLPVTLLASELQVQVTTVSYFQVDRRELPELPAQLLMSRVKKPTRITSIHFFAASDCQLNRVASKEPV